MVLILCRFLMMHLAHRCSSCLGMHYKRKTWSPQELSWKCVQCYARILPITRIIHTTIEMHWKGMWYIEYFFARRHTRCCEMRWSPWPIDKLMVNFVISICKFCLGSKQLSCSLNSQVCIPSSFCFLLYIFNYICHWRRFKFFVIHICKYI